MNGEYEVDKETFTTMDTAHQNWMLFKTFNAHRAKCEDRFCKLEKRKRFDTAVSGTGGFFGGLMAVILSKLWLR